MHLSAPRVSRGRERGLTLIETLTSLALISLCATLLLGTFMQLTYNQALMFQQSRALNIAQMAMAQAWNTGECESARNLALEEEMILTCTKVAYGARIELQWRLANGSTQQLQIN